MTVGELNHTHLRHLIKVVGKREPQSTVIGVLFRVDHSLMDGTKLVVEVPGAGSVDLRFDQDYEVELVGPADDA